MAVITTLAMPRLVLFLGLASSSLLSALPLGA
jgi:hypothetical protein